MEKVQNAHDYIVSIYIISRVERLNRDSQFKFRVLNVTSISNFLKSYYAFKALNV